MFLHIEPSSGVPIYRQLVQQIRHRIASGQLEPDEQLPSVRELSADLRLNPLTIAKAYSILEREGLVAMRRGLGTFVVGPARFPSAAEKRKKILPVVSQLAAEAHHLGLSEAEVHNLLAGQYRKFLRERVER